MLDLLLSLQNRRKGKKVWFKEKTKTKNLHENAKQLNFTKLNFNFEYFLIENGISVKFDLD